MVAFIWVDTIFCRINAPCALTDTLVNSGDPWENCRVFQLFLLIFDQFSPILRVIFHQKVPGMRLFKQVRLFGNIWYSLSPQIYNLHFTPLHICLQSETADEETVISPEEETTRGELPSPVMTGAVELSGLSSDGGAITSQSSPLLGAVKPTPPKSPKSKSTTTVNNQNVCDTDAFDGLVAGITFRFGGFGHWRYRSSRYDSDYD